MAVINLLSIVIGVFLVDMSDVDGLNVTILTLISDMSGKLPFHIGRSGPAVDLAIEKLVSETYLPPGVYVNVIQDSFDANHCARDVAALTAKYYYSHNLSALVGPGCSLAVAVVGRMAASWNLPIISPVATNGLLGDKDEFQTLTRLAYNMNKWAQIYLALFEIYGWEDIAIIHDESYVFFFIVGTSLDPEFETAGKRVYHQFYDTTEPHDLERIVKKASERSRVFVLAVDGDDLRRIMLIAQRLGMTNGEYVFIFAQIFKGDGVGDTSWRRGDELDYLARKAYEAVLFTQPRRPDTSEFLSFEQEVKDRAVSDYNYTYGEAEVNVFISAFHDAFMIYAHVLNETLASGENYQDGRLFNSKIWGKTFKGISGDIAIDENGDREMDFSLLDMDPSTGEYQVVGNYFGVYKKILFEDGLSIHWPDNKGPPSNVPRCGFLGDHPACQQIDDTSKELMIGLIFGAIIVLFAAITLAIYRKFKMESDLQSHWWRVQWKDVLLMHGSGMGSKLSSLQGNMAVITRLNVTSIKIDRNTLVELRQMRDMHCANLTKLYGLCTEDPNICLLTEHCTRGTLQDMLHNEAIKLDKDFKLSLLNDIVTVGVHFNYIVHKENTEEYRSVFFGILFVYDIVGENIDRCCVSSPVGVHFNYVVHKENTEEYRSEISTACVVNRPRISLDLHLIQGMCYIHGTGTHVHGRLRSANCLIDGRFVLKITDYGLSSLRLQELTETNFNKHVDARNLGKINAGGGVRDKFSMAAGYGKIGHTTSIRKMKVAENSKMCGHWHNIEVFCDQEMTNIGKKAQEVVSSYSTISYHAYVVPVAYFTKIAKYTYLATSLLYVAPEHLRADPIRSFSQPGDVYSFAIVLFELLTRFEPYEQELDTWNVGVLLERIQQQREVPVRPSLFAEDIDPNLLRLMSDCWQERPECRPSFIAIRKRIKDEFPSAKGNNILDTLLQRMEQYANNLEGLVDERTQAFLDEKRKAEELLFQILPKSVADRLKNGQAVNPEAYEGVTIYFSDIVGFTMISAGSSPMEVIDLLNDLYTCFDAIIENFDVYKVETIGDAYMVVSGLPVRNENEHVVQIARMSLSILESIKTFTIRHLPQTQLQARIGIHTGPVCAGVVGRKMPRYCLFGDTVNTASRMESNSEAMKIHISDSTMRHLSRVPSFVMEERGELDIKGKGTMFTYWLTDEQGLHPFTCSY